MTALASTIRGSRNASATDKRRPVGLSERVTFIDGFRTLILGPVLAIPALSRRGSTGFAAPRQNRR